MIAHRSHPPRWLRRSRVWWFETPRAEIVRMLILLAIVVVLSAAIVALVLTRD